MYKEILRDHCPFANCEWKGGGSGGPPPEKI